MSKKQQADPSKLSTEERYDFFVETVVEEQALWSLFGNDGWVLLTADQDTCIPFWPSEAIAKQMATQEWQGCKAKQVELTVWKERWVTGLNEDEILVSIFPNHHDNGTIDEPENLLLVLEAMEE